MPIEISGRTPQQTGGAGEGAQLRAVRSDDAATQKQAGAAATPRDTVSLTGAAALLHRIDAEIAAQPVVDTQRVEAIRQRIAEGSYEIDPLRVAGKLMQAEMALHGRG